MNRDLLGGVIATKSPSAAWIMFRDRSLPKTMESESRDRCLMMPQ